MTDNNKDFFTNEILSQLVADIGIAFWVWNTKTGDLKYNDAFSSLVGYDGVQFTYDMWNDMLHPDDFEIAESELNNYLDGKSDIYSIEVRLIREDGSIVWLSDSGKATARSETGEVLVISGVTQDITARKNSEELLRKEEDKLKLAMDFAGFTVWDWNLSNNEVLCSEEYARSLGYSDVEWFSTIEHWNTIVHPDDITRVTQTLDKCVSGEQKSYNHKLRIRKNNGDYTWIRDIGEVSKVDENGTPTQILGGRIDINELELATQKLERYQDDLEEQIKQRTEELLKRDRELLALNRISQKLMGTPTGLGFNEIAYQCLSEFTTVLQVSRLAIYRKIDVNDRVCCRLDNIPKSKYRTDFSINYVRNVFEDTSIEFLSKGSFTEEQRDEFYELILAKMESLNFDCIDFENDFPTVAKYVKENKVLNIKAVDFPAEEFVFVKLQGIKTILMAPIIVNNDFWGFILLDDYENKTFSSEDEKTLSLVGSVIAQAIHKNELDLLAKEAIEHNDLMLNALPIGCSLWENQDCIYVNDETLRLFDLEDSDDFKKNFNALVPKYQPCGQISIEVFEADMQVAIAIGSHRFEFMHIDLRGEEIPCEITLVKIRYSGKDLIACYSRDLREFKALMKQIDETQVNLKQAHEEALLSSQAKSNFLANMSHEIRTPMNAISGMTDIILRETTDSEVTEYALNIKRASESLLSIINDVLDISKIESGKLDIVEGKYKLSEVLQDVLTIATNRLELKPLMFTTNFNPDLPDELIGDDVRIKQIMVNLLNNAIKFTSEGSLSFHVTGEFAGGLLMLNFSISDTGSGISQEDMEKLFIEFERVNTTKNRTIEGTGLGLAISKRLCEMMNGEITVTSELGVGTTFTVSVMQHYDNYTPIAKVEQQKSVLVFESRELYLNSINRACLDLGLSNLAICSLQSEFNEALQDREFDFIFTTSMYLLKVQEMLLKHALDSKIVLLADNTDIKSRYDHTTIIIPAHCISISNVLNGKSVNSEDVKNATSFTAPSCDVLVVDDNLVNLKVAQGLMRPYQFKIETAENGKEAVSKIKSKQYDMVFMDHMMPIMDGIDATIAIRSIEGDYYQNLPIIALTANAIIGTKEMFINEGMNDFLAKPIKLTSLNDILAKWLPKDKQILDNMDDSTDEDCVGVSLTITDIDTKLGVNRVGGDFDTYVEILDMYYKDGLKRIPNIRNLYDNKQLLEYRIEVHALKSASASVGAVDISEKARHLEDAATKEDWGYIDSNTIQFIDEFNILLENIREALKGVLSEVDHSDKEIGDDSVFNETLHALSNAIDSIDINECDVLLDKLFSFNWDEEKLDKLVAIKDFVNGYEYDEAVEVIATLID